MNFLKTFLAALLAFVVANLLIAVFAVMVLAGIAAAFGEQNARPMSVPRNSVLRIDFANGVTDSPEQPLFTGTLGSMSLNGSNSIYEVLTAIDNASYDGNIAGIYIDVTGGDISLANIEELRAALKKFSDESGKFVVAYGESYSQLGYYLASVADKVFLHPEGSVEWKGLSSQVMFYKGLLNKLGVEMEILRHGEFKSAVEPFMLDRMSDESRLQMEELLGSVWTTIREDIAESRGLDTANLAAWARDLAMENAGSAVKSGLADGLAYEDRVLDLVARLCIDSSATITEDGGETAEQPTMVDLPDYIYTLTGRRGMGYYSAIRGDKIAVVYVDGEIIDGTSAAGAAGGATVAERLDVVRNDDRVKGVVLRVNSPGGSVMASEVIWRAVELLREKKPVVVSMGGYAASGGYYVSCPADMIITDRSTITGSIGVFGLVPNLGGALREKTGITVDVVGTGPHADMGSLFRPLDDTERAFLMRDVEQAYTTFVGHVADGRNMTREAVDAVGGGRVWSGSDAVDAGLADGIGGLVDAIEICADRAGVGENYSVEEAVGKPDALSMIVRSLGGLRIGAQTDEVDEIIAVYRTLAATLKESTVQARLPYTAEIR